MTLERNANTVSEWDGIYSNWLNEEKLHVRREEMAATHEAMLRLIPETGGLLDVGCGVGHLLGLCAALRPSLALTGVDFSATGLRIAAVAAPRARLHQRDFMAGLPDFFDGEFSCVVSSHVIEHMPDPPSHLAELWRLVAAGGRLIVNFPVGDPPYELHLHHELDLDTVHDWLSRVIGEPWGGLVSHQPVIPGQPNDNGIVWADKP